jgi:hypothetical protein
MVLNTPLGGTAIKRKTHTRVGEYSLYLALDLFRRVCCYKMRRRVYLFKSWSPQNAETRRTEPRSDAWQQRAAIASHDHSTLMTLRDRRVKQFPFKRHLPSAVHVTT